LLQACLGEYASDEEDGRTTDGKGKRSKEKKDKDAKGGPEIIHLSDDSDAGADAQ